MLGVLHGTSIAKVLIILGANYWVAKAPKSEWVERFWPGLVIGGNMMVLFLNERNDGYRFAHLHGAFEVLVSLYTESLQGALRLTVRTGWTGCFPGGISTSTSPCCA